MLSIAFLSVSGWMAPSLLAAPAELLAPAAESEAGSVQYAKEAGTKTLIFDKAGLLTREEAEELNALANRLGAKRETDIIIVTTDNPDQEDVMVLTQNFYDEMAPGYDRPHGNAVILTVDMYHREIYLAGFYKAEQYLDDSRLDLIRDQIIPYLSDGDYRTAFEIYIKKAHQYMGIRPGVDPENLLFQTWFQLTISCIIGGVVVGMMAYHSGGRVTVNHRTYEDKSTSGVVKQYDRYLRTTVTKRKIPENDSRPGGWGGGGGGGVTRGGHSHSGSRGSF